MKRRVLTIGRSMTIHLGDHQFDRPNAQLEAELEDGDDLFECAAELINEVNALLLGIKESEPPSE